MHATEGSRNSTCSTDNGSLHQDTRLTQVVSNQSAMSQSPKQKEAEPAMSQSPKQKEADPAIWLSTTDAPDAQAHLGSQSQNSTSRAGNLSSAAAVYLDTLLVTGQRKSWKFDPNDTVEAVRTHIWQNWPGSWPQPKPESSAYLRLLHLGHILDSPDITLASRGCKAGATTVVHIVIRSLPPPEPVKVEQESPVKTTTEARPAQRHHNYNRNRDQEDTPGCSCVIC
ncbi:hypothetical protein NDA12_002835 [Ustilago hordei]|nr:hypothetical protein NDA15_007527 [Ustilago hordei]KAJ1577217.1 hypothetical protein NDA12_002835 [Ustilago hordei]